MRVTTETLDEFFERIDNDPHVFQNAISASTIKKPINGTRYDALAFEVIFQASAVVIVQGRSEYLLEIGLHCGKDRLDGEPDLEGSNRADEYKQRIKEYAEKMGFKVLPGLIDF